MTCVHLQQLYKLCKELDLKLGGSDLIRVVCRQCDAQAVCPSTLTFDNGLQHSPPLTDAQKEARASVV
jgi:hypothetical protein